MTPTPNLERMEAVARAAQAIDPLWWGDLVEAVTADRKAYFDAFRPTAILALLSDLRTMAEERDRLRQALTLIADGSAPPDQNGHYLAHRNAVQIARTALSGLRLSEGGGRISSSSDALRGDGSLPVLAPAQNSDGGQD